MYSFKFSVKCEWNFEFTRETTNTTMHLNCVLVICIFANTWVINNRHNCIKFIKNDVTQNCTEKAYRYNVRSK